MTTRSDLRRLIRRRLGDNASPTQWSDLQINQWINDAIAEYSIHFPRKLDAAIPCIDGQRGYDLPEGFVLPEGREKPWGTGHATLAAKDLIDGPFVVINADDFYGARAFELLCNQLAGSDDDYAMVGYVLRDTLSDHGAVTRGVCRTEGDFLEKIDEISSITRDGDGAAYPDDSGAPQALGGDEVVSMNFWGFVPSIIPQLESGLEQFLDANIDDPKSEYLLPDVVDRLISEGRAKVRVLRGGGPWFGVTYQEDREHVARSIRKLVDVGEYPERLWR